MQNCSKLFTWKYSERVSQKLALNLIKDYYTISASVNAVMLLGRWLWLNWFDFLTRLHSSVMRTARLLTVSQHALQGGCTCQGVYCPGGVPARGYTCSGGVYPSMHWGRHPPRGQTPVKTLPSQTLFAGGHKPNESLRNWVATPTDQIWHKLWCSYSKSIIDTWCKRALNEQTSLRRLIYIFHRWYPMVKLMVEYLKYTTYQIQQCPIRRCSSWTTWTAEPGSLGSQCNQTDVRI